MVVSVTEKGIEKMSGVNQGRRTTVNHRTSVVIRLASKLELDVTPGEVWRKPVYWSGGVRRRGGVILIRALAWNCGNLRWRCQGKSTSQENEADSTEAPSRVGAIRSSDEGSVMELEQRDCVIRSLELVNCENRRSRLP